MALLVDTSRITELGLGSIAERGAGALPIASQENKLLQVEVLEQARHLSVCQREAKHHQERSRAMQEHLILVRQELQHSQALLMSREKLQEGETHMRMVAERETSRLTNEQKRIEAEFGEVTSRLSHLETLIFKGKQNYISVDKEIEWDSLTKQNWLDKEAKNEDDVITLEKYSRQDEAKIKSLSLAMEKLEMEAKETRKLLETEVTDTICTQIALDKIAEEFRITHKEREELLHQWEAILGQMQRRDTSIDGTNGELELLKTGINDQQNDLDDKKSFLESEEGNNKELETKHKIAERQVAKQRLDYQEAESSRLQFRDELSTLQYTVDRTAADLETLRGECNSLGRKTKERNTELENIHDINQELRTKLSKSTYHTLTSEEKAQKLESLLKEEERKEVDVDKYLEQLREMEFKRAQSLQEIKEKEGVLLGEQQGCYAAQRNLYSKLQKLDKQSLQQRELIYTQDYQSVQLEKRLARLEGETSVEEKKELESRISELSESQSAQDKQEILLKAQLKRLEDELRRAGREQDKFKDEETNLQGKIDELTLYLDNTQRLIKKVTNEKHEAMVDSNLLKLHVKRLRDVLFSRADEVLSLERRKLELNTAMSERLQEIKVFKEMLDAQVRTVDTERQKLRQEVYIRTNQIDKLQKRYEIVTMSLTPPEGEEVKSQAYFVIKAAQEREELQREGDTLDGKIRKAEREIRALENTLELIFGRNESFRKTLLRADDKGDLAGEKNKLENNLNNFLDKVKFKEMRVREISGDSTKMENMFKQLLNEEQNSMSALDVKKENLENMKHSISDQKEKVDRSLRNLTKVYKEVKSKPNVKEKLFGIDKDLQLRDLRDANVQTVQQLTLAANHEPVLLNTLQSLFSQSGVSITPAGSRSVSQQSSRTTSRVSSAATAKSNLSQTVMATPAVEIGMGLDQLSRSSLERRAPGGRTSGSSSKASSRASSASSVDDTQGRRGSAQS